MPDPNFRAWLEVAAFVSTVVVGIVAVVALWQIVLAKQALDASREQLRLAADSLRLAKDDIKIRSHREAVSLAAERCEKFAEQLLPKHQEHVEQIQKQGLKLFRWQMRDAEFELASFAKWAAADKWYTGVMANEVARKAMMAILNDLEAFAVYFARGAADEQVAYPVVGPLFCVYVETYAPHVAKVRAEEARGVISGPYQNVVDLYGMWIARSRKKQLEAEANRISLELSGIVAPEIRPIGTDQP